MMKGDTLLQGNPLWIVDVGASGGLHPRWAKFTSAFKGILFEPDPREYARLSAKGGDQLIVLKNELHYGL